MTPMHAMHSMQEEVFEWNGTSDSKGNESERIEHFRETYRAKYDPTDDEDSDGIITTNNITPAQAFEVFQGKVFFTRNEYTLSDSNEQRVETPMQRFTRLRIELESLESDLMSLAQTEKTDDATIWGTLQREAKKMVDTAASLEGHAGFRVFDRRMGNAGQRLDGLIVKTAVSSSDTHAAPAPVTSVSTAETSTVDMIELERRVFALEMFLGSATNAIDMEHSNSGLSGCGNWNSLPLADLVTRLEKQFSLLDPSALDNLRIKAAAAKVELESINRTKSSSQSASETKMIEAVKKVDDLYDQVQKVQAIAEDLPALVLRLKTLENVHQHATTFAVRLQALEKVAQVAVDDMQSNQEVLGHLQQGLTENLAIIKDSIVQVDQRIEKLNGTKS